MKVTESGMMVWVRLIHFTKQKLRNDVREVEKIIPDK
jgi:hypothetical protein